MAKENNGTVENGKNGDGKLYVVKTPYRRKDGTDTTLFFVSGKVLGQKMDARMVPEKGGYELLNAIFGNDKVRELVLVPYEIKDEDTGKTQRGFTYEVFTVDEDGDRVATKVKPNTGSDRAVLNNLLIKYLKTPIGDDTAA